AATATSTTTPATSPAAGAHRRRAAAATAWPTATVAASSRTLPPTRSTGASGPATCPMARLARGTPPKGQDHRTSSASVHVPTSASQRPRPGGAAATPAPSIAAYATQATREPGAVSAVIHDSDGRKHPMAATQPRRKRVPASWSATTRSSTASPAKASGHHPNSGSDRQRSTPAPSATSAGAKRRAAAVTAAMLAGLAPDPAVGRGPEREQTGRRGSPPRRPRAARAQRAGSGGVGGRRRRDVGEAAHDALLRAALGVAGEERGPVAVGLVDDVHRLVVDHLDLVERVDVAGAVGHREDQLVARLEEVEVVEGSGLRDSVARHHDVAQLARHRGARPVARAPVDGGQGDPFEHRLGQADGR